MSSWTTESLYDYFDQYAGVARNRAEDLRSRSAREQIEILTRVRETWAERLRGLEEDAFVNLLVALVEDLYFLGADVPEITRELLGYVVAVWGTGLHVASERGWRVRHVIDNRWSDPNAATAIFSLLAPAAEMTFVLALDDDAPRLLAELEGHALYLDPRAEPDCLDEVLTAPRRPGDIVIERHEAPEPGSPAHAWVTPRS